MLYFIRLKDHFSPKTVKAYSVETVKRIYPEWKVYCYKETGNPVVVNEDRWEEYRVAEVIRNVWGNKWCDWR